MARILVGTSDGLQTFTDGRPAEPAFGGRSVSALAREGLELWAVLDDREVWHTAAQDWWFRVAGLEEHRPRCLADTRAGVIVGTSEARLYRVAGEGLEPVEGFDGVDGRDGWYTPWGGPPDTRSISEDGDTVYANVHVGGIVRSRDHGRTWVPTIDVDADVHRVWAGDPGVFAACGLGLAASSDGGDTWEIESDGLHATYCRGVTVCGDTVLVSASDGPRGGRAGLYRRALAGGSIERCRNGLPEWFDDNVDSACLDGTDELAAFGTADGRVFGSRDGGATWEEVASGLPSIECVLVMP